MSINIGVQTTKQIRSIKTMVLFNFNIFNHVSDTNEQESKFILEDHMGDEGTFLTSLKGKNNPNNQKNFNDEQKALVLFGPPKEKQKSGMKRNSSTTTIDDRQLKNFKKPPIYLPELRDRKDVWMGKSSGDLIAQKKPGHDKKPFDPTAHLRANKNWFLVPDRNVLL